MFVSIGYCITRVSANDFNYYYYYYYASAYVDKRLLALSCPSFPLAVCISTALTWRIYVKFNIGGCLLKSTEKDQICLKSKEKNFDQLRHK